MSGTPRSGAFRISGAVSFCGREGGVKEEVERVDVEVEERRLMLLPSFSLTLLSLCFALFLGPGSERRKLAYHVAHGESL